MDHLLLLLFFPVFVVYAHGSIFSFHVKVVGCKVADFVEMHAWFPGFDCLFEALSEFISPILYFHGTL